MVIIVLEIVIEVFNKKPFITVKMVSSNNNNDNVDNNNNEEE